MTIYYIKRIFMGQKKKIFAWIAGILVLAILAVIGIFIVHQRAEEHPISSLKYYPVQQTQLSKAINLSSNMQKANYQIASMMTTPVSEKWWNVTTSFTQSISAKRYLPYKYVSNAKSYTSFLSTNTTGKSSKYVGVTTILVEYANNKQANAALSKIHTFNAIQNIWGSTMGNYLIVHSANGATDDLFNRDAFTKASKEFKKITYTKKAYWLIDFAKMKEVLQTRVNSSSSDKQLIEKIMSSFGIDTTTKNAMWVGTSTNGTHWVGHGRTYNNQESATILTPQTINYSNVDTTLSKTIKVRWDAPGATWMSKDEADKWLANYYKVNKIKIGPGTGMYGSQIRNQAAALDYIAFQTKDTKKNTTVNKGGLLQTDYSSTVGKQSLPSNAIARISIDPSMVIGYLNNQDYISTMFGVSRMTFTIFDKQSMNIDLVFD